MLSLALLRRGFRLWVLARLLMSALFFLSQTDPLRLPTMTTVVFVLTCVMLGYVEVHLNHERDLLANLGLGRRVLMPYFLVPAVLGELLIRVVAAVT
jgi:hypothetical protein